MKHAAPDARSSVNMKKSIFLLSAFFFFFFASLARSSTLVLEGRIDGSIEVTQERVFTAPKGGLNRLVFRFANPASFKSRTVAQDISGHNVEYYPRPESVKAEKDRFGNSFTVVTWTELKGDAKVKEVYRATLGIDLKDVSSPAAYPLDPKEIPGDEKRFLADTPLVESGNAEIKTLARSLSRGAGSEQEAVMSVLNWVVDNIKYKTPVEDYGALRTLKTRQGNCQNFSHLSIALLRSIGIPARIAGGVSLGKSWRVPLKEGALSQSIGQGGHAWFEVWYPDLGWLPYDAQQSHLFVGPRHIKQTVGLDSVDINDSWRASPILPRFREEISAEYLKDDIAISLKESRPEPMSYIMTGSIVKEFKPTPQPPRPEEPPSPVKEAAGAEFGNMEFPSLIDFYVRSKEDVGRKTFDKETAEYVTGEHTFAQAFTVPRALKIESISLAMHKFGGRAGSLWIDVVKDDHGRPGMEGVRSLPLYLDEVVYYPGYKWFDFSLGGGVFSPGKYWIILRHSKDAVVNWFYTPGNPYEGPDDARSTGTGIDWSDIMNYDFNFRVKGAFTDKKG